MIFIKNIFIKKFLLKVYLLKEKRRAYPDKKF